jgi:hypothetical protein
LIGTADVTFRIESKVPELLPSRINDGDAPDGCRVMSTSSTKFQRLTPESTHSTLPGCGEPGAYWSAIPARTGSGLLGTSVVRGAEPQDGQDAWRE